VENHSGSWVKRVEKVGGTKTSDFLITKDLWNPLPKSL